MQPSRREEEENEREQLFKFYPINSTECNGPKSFEMTQNEFLSPLQDMQQFCRVTFFKCTTSMIDGRTEPLTN